MAESVIARAKSEAMYPSRELVDCFVVCLIAKIWRPRRVTVHNYEKSDKTFGIFYKIVRPGFFSGIPHNWP
jgi:hypothetical protein